MRNSAAAQKSSEKRDCGMSETPRQRELCSDWRKRRTATEQSQPGRDLEGRLELQDASDQPRTVSVRSTNKEVTLIPLSTRPVPRSARRDSALQQSAMMTREMASQAKPEGSPG